MLDVKQFSDIIITYELLVQNRIQIFNFIVTRFLWKKKLKNQLELSWHNYNLSYNDMYICLKIYKKIEIFFIDIFKKR